MEMAETDKYKSQYPVEMVVWTRLEQKPFPLLDEKTEIGQHQSPAGLAEG